MAVNRFGQRMERGGLWASYSILRFGISYLGKLGRTVVDIGERTPFLEGVTKHQIQPTSLNPFQESDHLRSC